MRARAGSTVFQGDLIAARFPDAALRPGLHGRRARARPDRRAVVTRWRAFSGPAAASTCAVRSPPIPLARGFALGSRRGHRPHADAARARPTISGSSRRARSRGWWSAAGLGVERLRQSKIPPGHAHGRQVRVERAALAVFRCRQPAAHGLLQRARRSRGDGSPQAGAIGRGPRNRAVRRIYLDGPRQSALGERVCAFDTCGARASARTDRPQARLNLTRARQILVPPRRFVSPAGIPERRKRA